MVQVAYHREGEKSGKMPFWGFQAVLDAVPAIDHDGTAPTHCEAVCKVWWNGKKRRALARLFAYCIRLMGVQLAGGARLSTWDLCVGW